MNKGIVVVVVALKGLSDALYMYKSHNGTETERPSLARGICEFHQSYF